MSFSSGKPRASFPAQWMIYGFIMEKFLFFVLFSFALFFFERSERASGGLQFFFLGGVRGRVGGKRLLGPKRTTFCESHCMLYHVCNKVCRGSNFRVHRTLMILDVVSPFLST